MRRATIVLGSLLVSVATACGPTLNWRDVAIDASGLVALFPCKPEQATREVSMGPDQIEMTLRSCDADGVKFAVGRARLVEPGRSAVMLAQWREATLAAIGASRATGWDASPRQIAALPQALAARVAGRRPDNSSVMLQGVWFVQGPDMFAALMYSDGAAPEAAASFFSGLRFR